MSSACRAELRAELRATHGESCSCSVAIMITHVMAWHRGRWPNQQSDHRPTPRERAVVCVLTCDWRVDSRSQRGACS